MSIRWLVESLESRQLFHGGAFDLHVNFQPAASAVPAGYLADGPVSGQLGRLGFLGGFRMKR